MSPPAAGFLARHDSESSGDERLSAANSLARWTLRRLPVTEPHSPHDTGSGVNSNTRRPPTPPTDTRTGQPATHRATRDFTPRAYDASRSRHSSAKIWRAFSHLSTGTATCAMKRQSTEARGKQSDAHAKRLSLTSGAEPPTNSCDIGSPDLGGLITGPDTNMPTTLPSTA